MLLQFSAAYLAPLWPAVLTELVLILQQLWTDVQRAAENAAVQTSATANVADATADVSGRPAQPGGLALTNLPGALVGVVVSTADVVATAASAVVAPVVSLVNDAGVASAATAPLTPSQALAVLRFLDLAFVVAPDEFQMCVRLGLGGEGMRSRIDGPTSWFSGLLRCRLNWLFARDPIVEGAAAGVDADAASDYQEPAQPPWLLDTLAANLGSTDLDAGVAPPRRPQLAAVHSVEHLHELAPFMRQLGRHRYQSAVAPRAGPADADLTWARQALLAEFTDSAVEEPRRTAAGSDPANVPVAEQNGTEM